MMRLSTALPLALTLACSSLAACASDESPPTAGDDSDLSTTSTEEPGISVEATYGEAYVGTPTYGSMPRTFLKSVSVEVNDQLLRERHPGFDGFERPFVLVPIRDASGVRWERLSLKYYGTHTVYAYMSGTPSSRDSYDLPQYREVEEGLLQTHGIAVGLETNLGEIWAQRPGKNFTATKERNF